MKAFSVRFALAALVLGLAAVSGASQARLASAHKPAPPIAITGPTMIAFFPTTQAEVDRNPDTGEAISDFQFYINETGKKFKEAGIKVVEVYEPNFRIQTGKSIRLFPNPKGLAGYYFVAPGRGPHVEYNVMTGEDLIDAARRYFRVPIR